MADRDEVVVIGAGPVGLAVAKALKERGIPYRQLEATDHVGGNWAHGVYETAHIISSRRTTEYSDHPMPSDWPDFPSAAQMCAYFNDYADTYDLRGAIRFGQRVTAVRPVGGGWEVTTEGGDANGGATASPAKAVVVCNGHHWQRAFPAWVSGFEGELLHSKDYRRPEQLRGKRVLVLGGGNSGCDVASEAARVATSAAWSLRRGYWFLPKTLLGRPTVELMSPWAPVGVQRAMIKAALRLVVGPYSSYGLPEPDHDLFEAHPTVSTEVFHYLRHGTLSPRPDVVAARGRTVVFADGREEDFDVIVCATGFDVVFPFLPDGMVPVRGKVAELYAGMLRPAWRHLYVFGTTQPRYGLGPLVRPGALLLADWIALQDELQVPLGQVVASLGFPPARTHLQDPHAVLRQLAIGRRLLPLLRWQGKRLDRAAAGAPSAGSAAV